MSSHLELQMEKVKQATMGMAHDMTALIQDGFQALCKMNPELARKAIEADRAIDLLENKIEQQVVTLMGTQQPVAKDLRFLTATVKNCAFFERMADQGVNLAQRAEKLVAAGSGEPPDELCEIFDLTMGMVEGCVSAYGTNGSAEARQLIAQDEEVDFLTRRFLESSILSMQQGQLKVETGVELILASRHLERIADLACNVAENVIFAVEGEVVRHKPKK